MTLISEVSIESAVQAIIDYRGKTPVKSDAGVRLVTAKVIKRGRIEDDPAEFIAEESYDAWMRRGLPQSGDSLITTEAPLGEVAMIGDDPRIALAQRVILLRANPAIILPRFLYYELQTDFVQAGLAARATGTTVLGIKQSELRQVKIRALPLPIQRRIASILSAYDDLIENNRKRIAILEDIARRLYREWFVHFRYPGHESVPLVDSPLGRIPQGWEVKPLGEEAAVIMGTSPKGDTYNEDGVGTPLVNGPVEFGDRFTKRVKWTTEPTRMSADGDLIVCVRGSTTGKNVKSDGIYCLGRGVCGIRHKVQPYIDQVFQNDLPALLAQTSGSTFPSWTGPQLHAHPVLSPSSDLLALFGRQTEPADKLVSNLAKQIQVLRRTRDLLLPRLMSGTLSVEALATAEAAAS